MTRSASIINCGNWLYCIVCIVCIMYMCFELYTPDWKVSKNHNLRDLVSQKLQHMHTFVVKTERGGKGVRVGGFL